MAIVRRTDEAIDDLIAIWTWIAVDNITAADRLIREIDDLIVHLASHPLIGERCAARRRVFRRLSHGNYVIYYHVRGDVVTIVRVLHGARDHGPLL